MGLDMHACCIKENPGKETDFLVDGPTLPLHYWREHIKLDKWITERYYAKGGTEDFIDVNVLLTADDLDQLEAAIRARQLRHRWADGDADIADDLDFISKARAALAMGLHVVYRSG